MNLRRSLAGAVAGAMAISMLGGAPAVAHPGPHEDAHVLIFTKTTQFRHTEAIEQGVPVLTQAFADAGISSEHTEDSSIFNDEDLAHFDALVMFQASGDPWNAEEKAALERYMQGGGGIVAIHNATDMRGNYTWWDEMIGALMPGHAATGSSPGLPGTVRVEDRTHPSTEHLPLRWNRADEWYNYSANVRGEAHVLATMDESTYDPGGNAMGYDHPISWCKPYDGGRAWMTGMGHFGAHYTGEPFLVQHILGGVKYAAGMEAGDCGGTVWDQFERVPLDQNTSAPFAIDVAPDGRVFYTELVRGQIRVYDPEAQTTTTAVTIPVYSGGEDGLLGIALDPDFADNGHLYVYYSPASGNDTDPANFRNRLSRFTVGSGSQIDPATEKVLLEVPARRLPDEPGHTGGGLDFGPDGSLYLGVGDDVNPHSEPSGGYAPLSERDGTFHDARATSANTNDLRGKLLRIMPQDDGTYTIPEGNLFPPGTAQTRPEIYAMGFRNPFRFSIDQETGHISMADYSPDNSADNPNNRGPAGIAEWTSITEPGFYGWPLCMGNNEPFRDVDYRTNPVTVGAFFDCANPVNDSIHNTGLVNLPPAKPADMFYGYQRSSVPQVIPQGGGLAPMGGPVYHYDPDLASDTKFPSSYDGKAFFYEWARNKMYSIIPTADGTAVEKVNPFLPQEQFLAPIDSKFGPEGSMYVLDWGGGFGRDNPNSGLYRVDYVSGSRSPTAKATATPDSGQAPLEVTFDGGPSTDPENEALTYAWDFTGDGTTDSTDATPSFTYGENGVYNARLTVTDPHGKTGTTTVPITVGNTRPAVDFQLPPTGSFFDFGDEISWQLDVSDAEDTEIADEDIVVQPALGHDDHPHPADPSHGRTGSVVTALGGGHSEDMNVFYVIDARYTDSGGDGDIPALTGSDTTLLFPKQREAEFYESSNAITVGPSRDVEGHVNAITGQNGAWAAYDPVSLRNVDALVLRASATEAGAIELRNGAPDGPLLGTAQVPATGPTSYVDVPVAVDDPGESFTLYAVFPGAGERRLNFIEADGKGASPTTKPKVAVTAPTSEADLEPGAIPVRASASDGENTITKVEFFVDGQSIGVDTSAPYEVTWNATTEARYKLTAVATNDKGAATTSRIVPVEVGDLYGDWQTFGNVTATYDRPDTDTWIVTAGGANMWQGTDEYGAVYLPGAAGTEWTATVKVERQGNSAGSAKAGIIVRNDVTRPGSSPGYGMLAIRPSGGFEWLRDSDGNGQLDASTGASSTSYPAWVRLVRDGDAYTAYWSKDGTNFTAVGTPVALPNGTSAQDVGLAVTAHNAGATSEVEFSGFTLDDEAWTPGGEEPEPEPGPGCVVQGTDAFDGPSVDRTRWTTVRNGQDLPVRIADGKLVLPVTNGDINEASAGPISYVGQPVRTGAWTATTSVSLAHTREWQHAGMLVHAGDDDYVKLAFTRDNSGGRLLEFQTEADGTRAWHDNVALPADFPATAHLRLVSDGSRLTAAYSTDGQTWTALAGSAAVLAGATVGLVAAGDTAAHAVDASFDHFTVTPDTTDTGVREPGDEFDGSAVDGCRWNSVVRYDSGHVAVTGGQLRIQTQPGDINAGNNDSPRNFVLQRAPDGDWTVDTRVTPAMLHRWQLAGLIVYGDDDNYVKFDVVAQNASGAAVDLRAELVSEKGGEFGNGGNRNVDVADTVESGWYHLRLTRTGDSYAAWISPNGTDWTSLGDPVTNDGDLSSVGLLAIGPEQTAPVTVAFDWFRLSTPDTSAPVVTTAVSTPDGQNGWHRTPATVTATAVDDRDLSVPIEYRTGAGEWVAYDGPVALAGDGTHNLEFRATDAAGNTSEAAPAMAMVDRTAPLVSVGGVAANGKYDLGKLLSVSTTADDPASGVASVAVTLDGQAFTTPASVEPLAGAHRLTAVATDEAGNVTEVSVAFAVVPTYATAAKLLTRYRADGRLGLASYLQLYVHLHTAALLTEARLHKPAAQALDRFATVARTVRDTDVRARLLAVAAELRTALRA